MPIDKVEFVCDRCGESISFPGSAVGTVQECPHCGGFVDVDRPGEGQDEDPDEAYAKRAEQQWEESARQLERAAQLQAEAEERLRQLERFLARCEQLAERFDKVLTRWEEEGR
jgi:hypothetical protein